MKKTNKEDIRNFLETFKIINGIRPFTLIEAGEIIEKKGFKLKDILDVHKEMAPCYPKDTITDIEYENVIDLLSF